MSRPRLLLVAGGALALTALGASRPRYGGELRVVVAGSPAPEDPALADTPADAAISWLTAPALCRLDANLRPTPVLTDEITWLGPQRLRIGLGGSRATPAAIAERWERLSRTATLSPYRALLYPLRDEGRRLTGRVTDDALELSLAFPWPDLERSLCHPALGIPGNHGAFLANRGRTPLLANPAHAAGRPFVDRLLLAVASERDAARRLELNQAEVLLGAGEDSSPAPPPALSATYLAYRPSRVGASLGRSVEAAIDRADLTRYFVRGPAVPMSALLPPALMPQPTLVRPPPPASENRDVTLLYDAGLDDQRAVAERLQVKLHDRGYRVALKALSRGELRRRWAQGDFDLMLHAVLLPPLPGPALAVVLDLAGRHDLLPTELRPIGALADPAERDAKVRQRAEALRETLPLIPLYAQGLAVRSSSQILPPASDGQGLPLLDDLFLVR